MPPGQRVTLHGPWVWPVPKTPSVSHVSTMARPSCQAVLGNPSHSASEKPSCTAHQWRSDPSLESLWLPPVLSRPDPEPLACDCQVTGPPPLDGDSREEGTCLLSWPRVVIMFVD